MIGNLSVAGNGDSDSRRFFHEIESLSRALTIRPSSGFSPEPPNPSRRGSSSIWGWTPLRAFSRLRRRRRREHHHIVRFSLHVLSIHHLPAPLAASASASTTAVTWTVAGSGSLSVPAAGTSGGSVSFAGSPMLQTCNVLATTRGGGGGGGIRRPAKYVRLPSTLSVSVSGALVLCHEMDLTWLLPLTLEELTREKSSGRLTHSLPLANSAAGAVLTMTFGYALVDGDGSGGSGGDPLLPRCDHQKISEVVEAGVVGNFLKRVVSVPSSKQVGQRPTHSASLSMDANDSMWIVPVEDNKERIGCGVVYIPDETVNPGDDQVLDTDIVGKSLNRVVSVWSCKQAPQRPTHSASLSVDSTKDLLKLLPNSIWAENDTEKEKDGCKIFSLLDEAVVSSSVKDPCGLKRCVSDKCHETGMEMEFEDPEPEFEVIEKGVEIDGEAKPAEPLLGFGLKTSHERDVNFSNLDNEGRSILFPELAKGDIDVSLNSLSISDSLESDAITLTQNTPRPVDHTDVKLAYRHGQMGCRSFSYNDLTESITDEFLRMLEMEQNPAAASYYSDQESGEEPIWKTFERKSNCGYLLDGEAEFPSLAIHDANMGFLKGVQLPGKLSAKMLEEAEAKELMSAWGVDEKVFTSFSRPCEGGFGSPIELSP